MTIIKLLKILRISFLILAIRHSENKNTIPKFAEYKYK